MWLLSKNPKGLIFILMLILLSNFVFAQQTTGIIKENIKTDKLMSLIDYKEQSKPTPFLLRKNLYVSQWGFMCKKEWQVEKKTGIPFRFRLGSASYCDWLEGKPNAVRQNP